jgi:hypothetical protein
VPLARWTLDPDRLAAAARHSADLEDYRPPRLRPGDWQSFLRFHGCGRGATLQDLRWVELVEGVIPADGVAALAGRAPLPDLLAAADMADDLFAAGVGPAVALYRGFGELGSWLLDYAATTVLVRARLAAPPRAYLVFGVAARAAAAYEHDEVVVAERAGSAAAGHMVSSWATLAAVTGNPQWLWPLVAHTVAASEHAPMPMQLLADRRLERFGR